MLFVAIIIIVVIIALALWWWLSRCPAEPAASYPPRPAGEVKLPAAPDVTARAPSVKAGWPDVSVAPPAGPDLAAKVPSVKAEWPDVSVAPPAGPDVAAKVPSVKAEWPDVSAEPPAAAPQPPPAPPAPDDLKIIEGIGPKISGMLQAQGISTFAQLAAADVERLRGIMLAANLRIADPTTWPEQAALAAAGKWDELQALQNSLKGGRKV